MGITRAKINTTGLKLKQGTPQIQLIRQQQLY